jgi:hypothetical protein
VGGPSELCHKCETFAHKKFKLIFITKAKESAYLHIAVILCCLKIYLLTLNVLSLYLY